MEHATLMPGCPLPTRVQLDPQRASDHVDRLFRAAWALCGSRQDAEDLVQETYARVLAKPRFLRSEDDLGYLLRTLRNTFLNQKRTESRRLGPARSRTARRRRRPARNRSRDCGRGRRGLRGRRRAACRLPRRARRSRRHRPLATRRRPGSADPRGDRDEPPLPRPPAGRAAGRRRLGVSRISPAGPGRRAPSRPTTPGRRPPARA